MAAPRRSPKARLRWHMRLPLFLLIWGIAALSMLIPAAHALAVNQHGVSRDFLYAAILGLMLAVFVGIALGGRESRHSPISQLLSLLATFTVLPVFLAIPFHEALPTTSFFNVYFDMVSSITTTGADLFNDPARRLPPSLHLWRAQVGWMGGLLMWIAASAILAPLSLGGFEVTAQGEPGRGVSGAPLEQRADPRLRLARVAVTLAPIYIGLTVAAWVLLLISGESSLVALCHAMSVMATSGISPVGGVQFGASAVTGEIVMFLFMFFALSRLTFSSDTVIRGYSRLDKDPEFRVGVIIVVAVPLLLFLRHWIAAFETNAAEDTVSALRAFWGAMFTVMAYLTTTGFESADWDAARTWSGLGTPGVILMGLALFGGGVATTAGGVKLLRVYALYLTGLREMHKLVHPHSVSRETAGHKRIQRDGAFIAFIFFMLFALSLALVSVVMAALGSSFEHSLVLAIATLSTTGPLIESAPEVPIDLIGLGGAAKAVLCFTMILGRLETLAIIALFNRELWRG